MTSVKGPSTSQPRLAPVAEQPARRNIGIAEQPAPAPKPSGWSARTSTSTPKLPPVVGQRNIGIAEQPAGQRNIGIAEQPSSRGTGFTPAPPARPSSSSPSLNPVGAALRTAEAAAGLAVGALNQLGQMLHPHPNKPAPTTKPPVRMPSAPASEDRIVTIDPIERQGVGVPTGRDGRALPAAPPRMTGATRDEDIIVTIDPIERQGVGVATGADGRALPITPADEDARLRTNALEMQRTDAAAEEDAALRTNAIELDR